MCRTNQYISKTKYVYLCIVCSCTLTISNNYPIGMKIASPKLKLLFLLLFLVQIPCSFAQQTDSTCQVLLKAISGSYAGGCKHGLADGKGTAKGEDTYVGYFLKGLPEGKGEYTYKNGNVFSGAWSNGLKNGKGKFKSVLNGKTSVVTGYWKDGEYAGISEPDDEYRITNISRIENYSIKKTASNVNMIEISFEKVMKKYIPRDLSITLSSGYKIEQNLKIIVQNYSLPVNCSLHFTIPTSGGDLQCNFAFNILNPGKYEVFISNN